MAEEVLAHVPDRPVRVKITNPDGTWAKATVSRVPADAELKDGESVEVIEDEAATDVYGAHYPTEYGGESTESAKPAKKAAASPKEGEK